MKAEVLRLCEAVRTAGGRAMLVGNGIFSPTVRIPLSAIASVLVVIGLLANKQWAWVLAIVSSGLILAIDLGWWWSGEPRYGSMLINSVAVFYLNQRDVRTALRGMVPTS